MSQLLTISFDVSASPSIWLRQDPEVPRDEVGAGWGFAWYPKDSYAAAVVRDPRPVAETALTRVLRDWDRFRGTIFMCHIRGAAKRPTEQDTHPFTRQHGGRVFTFAHNGQLDPPSVRALSLGDAPVFEPVGTTDSERAFCWLLTQLRDVGAKSLAAAGFERLHGWFRELNELGTFNVMMSDGHDVVAYGDGSGFRPLYFTRRTPPHAKTRLDNGILELDHSDPLDANRTMVIVATTPLDDEWTPLGKGQILVMRRGAISYSSASTPSPDRSSSVEPVGGWRPSPAGPPPTESAGNHASAGSQVAANGGAPPPTSAPAVRKRRFRVLHKTRYEYDEPVERSTHVLRLQPVHGPEQHLLEHSVDISVDCGKRCFEDVFTNRSMRVWITQPYDALEVVAKSIVEVHATEIPTPRGRTTLPMVWMPWQRQMMTPFLLPPELPETQLRELSAFAMSFAERQDYDLTETLRDINMTIRRDFSYVQGVTSIETTPFDVYANRRGVCQDFANLFICLARLLSVPSRYRVGYIHTGASYDNEVQSEASHAWVEVYLPWAGWRGFDPTNGCLVGLDHICVAAGRNYRDATPTSGTLYKGGAGEKLSVVVEVEALEPEPEPE